VLFGSVLFGRPELIGIRIMVDPVMMSVRKCHGCGSHSGQAMMAITTWEGCGESAGGSRSANFFTSSSWSQCLSLTVLFVLLSVSLAIAAASKRQTKLRNLWCIPIREYYSVDTIFKLAQRYSDGI
jgi:preprotein translocase subunit SecG